MSYRLRGKCWLFTWAQCDTDHVSVWDALNALIPIRKCVIAREPHQDGNPHFHAHVVAERAVDRNLSAQLDLAGKHPNVKPKRFAKEIKTSEEYCRKDTEWIEFGYDEDDEEEEPGTHDLLGEAAHHSSWGSYLQWAYENQVPFPYAKSAWDCVLNHRAATYEDGDEYNGAVQHPLLLGMRFDPTDDHNELCKKTWVIQGPTGIGKTSWAILNMPRPSLVVSHVDDLKAIREGFHKSLIFDDFSLMGDPLTARGTWPVTSQIHLLDHYIKRPIHNRYVNAFVPPGLYKVFTCNPGRYPLSIDPAVQRRVHNIIFEEL